MKVKHMLFILFALVGLLYVVHIYTSHGGMMGFRKGLSIGS